MKIQNLIVIFIIIIIPLILIFSLYLNLETKTITLQTDYDEKLIEATKEAIEAFEINTIDWSNEYSTLANSKRQNIIASINTFTSSLANKLGVGGTSKENILTYVPAIVYTMYDGYYIYSPTYVPQTITNENGVQLFYYRNSTSENTKVTDLATQNIGGTIVAGEPMYVGTGLTGTYNGSAISFTTDANSAKKVYKHVLKTFVPYTTDYEANGKKYVINYSLDNYIRVYGENVSKEGYIIEGAINVPVLDSISGISFNGKTISPEILTENVPIRNSINEEIEIKTYPYVYNSNNEKRYYDIYTNTDKFFTINKDYVRVDLPETTVGTTVAEYKKLVIRTNQNSSGYIEIYQLLNGNDPNWYYLFSNNRYLRFTRASLSIRNIGRYQDCSAISYYVENYMFNNWLNSTSFDTDEILAQKNEKIITNINNNLNLSISNYSANSNNDYKLPEIALEDWEQALSNISVIAFFQGANIGLKVYNNYAVVSSTQNNEFINEEALYYIETQDEYYHRYGCSAASNNIGQLGVYLNTEFKAKSYNYTINGAERRSGYYFKHRIQAGSNEIGVRECFDCIVNRNNYEEDVSKYNKVFYTALARERYIKMQKTTLIRQ